MNKRIVIIVNIFLCFLFASVFSAFFLKTVLSWNDRPWYSLLSAFLSFSAFVCCGVILILKLSSDVRSVFRPVVPKGAVCPGALGSASSGAGYKANWKDVVYISLGVTLFFFLTVLLIQLLGAVYAGGKGFSYFQYIWTSLDSKHYLYIAEHGYTRDTPDADIGRVVEIVFFPLFPLIVAALGRVIGSFLIAGLIVSYVSFGFAMYFLFRLVSEKYGRISGFAAIVAVMILPGSFFFVAPMTESLFLALTLGAVYFIKKEKWLAAAFMGFFSALTRNLGVLVAAVYVYELLLRLAETVRECRASVPGPDRDKSRKDIRRYVIRLFFVVLIPAGTAVYLAINHALYGNAFAFIGYEKSNWSQSLGWFFNTAEYCARIMVNYMKDPESAAKGMALWAMNLFSHFGVLALLISRHRKLRTSYYAYSLFYFAISMGATWLLSGTRYMLGLYTLPLIVPGVCGTSDIFGTKKDRGSGIVKRYPSPVRIAGVCIFAAAMLFVGFFYAVAFVKRLQVW